LHYPYQIGGKDDDPNDAVDVIHSIKDRDIIIMGTDGFFSNYDVYQRILIGFYSNFRGGLRESPQILAEKFARETKISEFGRVSYDSPFNSIAKRFGKNKVKRKQNDASVIISEVRLNPEKEKDGE
jgi:hypothetical protein